LFDEYGGAAAAYSLRRLGSAYSGPLVRVRRDGDADGTTNERDFTSTTQIADWVNGKLETTLPADVDTASAAYSLRKVKADYTGDAVRIRRASDDVEVNVAFDTNGAVSASSAITNVTESPDQGDTTATTLGGFLTGNENSLVDFSSGSDNIFSHDDQTTIAFASYGNDLSRTAYNHLTDSESIGSSPVSTSDYSFRFDSRVSSGYNAAHGIVIGPKVEQYFYSVTFKYYIPEGEPSLSIVYGTAVAPLNVKGAWAEATITSQVGQSHRGFLLRSGAFGSTGGLWYIADVRLNLSAFDTFVHTWYDQSGSGNDATQDVAGNQPKIAEAGALLADGIDFDGADDKLNFTALSASDLSIFSVVTFDSVAGQERIIGPQTGNSEGFGISNATTGFFRGSGGTANSPALNATISADTATLYSLIRASNTGTFFTDSTASATFSNTDTFAGASLGGATNPVDGSLKEIIIYNSDQSSNRFKIESNINNYYGIYTASHNGFVENWYDQSGNGNHAEQLTLGDQPKIVSNGNLLADGIDFDGVNHYLVAPDANVLDLTIPCCFFTVQKYSAIPTTFQRILAKELSSNGYNIGASSSGQFDIDIGTADGNGGSVTTNKTVTSWIVAPDVSADNIKVYDNGALVLTTSSVTDVPANTDGLGIGARPNGTVLFDGSMSEIVIYDSDQSANRTGIESNIADEYGITLP
jgi:hypothetical protein